MALFFDRQWFEEKLAERGLNPRIMAAAAGMSEADLALARYDDPVAEIAAELAQRRDAALTAGVDPGHLVLDPGIGFSKDATHNWAVLAGWDAFEALGHPLLLAVSRKRFLGHLLARPAGPIGRELRPPASSQGSIKLQSCTVTSRPGAIWLDHHDKKLVVFSEEMILNQLRRDGPKIEVSFDYLCDVDLRELSTFMTI